MPERIVAEVGAHSRGGCGPDGVLRGVASGRPRFLPLSTPERRLNCFRRPTVRYEPRDGIHLAFCFLSCTLSCIRRMGSGTSVGDLRGKGKYS